MATKISVKSGKDVAWQVLKGNKNFTTLKSDIRSIDRAEGRVIASYKKLVDDLLIASQDAKIKTIESSLKAWTKDTFSVSWSKKINGFIGGVIKSATTEAYDKIDLKKVEKIETVTELFDYVRTLKPTNKKESVKSSSKELSKDAKSIEEKNKKAIKDADKKASEVAQKVIEESSEGTGEKVLDMVENGGKILNKIASMDTEDNFEEIIKAIKEDFEAVNALFREATDKKDVKTAKKILAGLDLILWA